MPLKQAIIPAAGRGLKPYPAWDTVEKLMHPVIDIDGLAKPVLQILADEALAAGVDEIILVVRPREEYQYLRLLDELISTLSGSSVSRPEQIEQAKQLGDLVGRLRFAVQEEALGFGHAIWCARKHITGGHWLLCPSDHLFLHSVGAPSAGAQLAAAFGIHRGAISTVEALGAHQINRYGVIAAQPVAGVERRWLIEQIIEKPTPTQAELYLETPGLRRDTYLCFSGLHILPTKVLDLLDQRVALKSHADWGELSPVLHQWAQEHDYFAMALQGYHQDIGTKYGLLEAQLERALCGPDRASVLARLSSSLAADALMRESCQHGR